MYSHLLLMRPVSTETLNHLCWFDYLPDRVYENRPAPSWFCSLIEGFINAVRNDGTNNEDADS